MKTIKRETVNTLLKNFRDKLGKAFRHYKGYDGIIYYDGECAYNCSDTAQIPANCEYIDCYGWIPCNIHEIDPSNFINEDEKVAYSNGKGYASDYPMEDNEYWYYDDWEELWDTDLDLSDEDVMGLALANDDFFLEQIIKAGE